jgi:hypothetical protein
LKKIIPIFFWSILTIFVPRFGTSQVLLNSNSTLTAGTNLTCGSTFLDNGGTGNYLPDTDFTITLCAAPGQFLSVTLSSVSISSNSGGGGANQPDFFYVNTGSGFTLIPNTGGSGSSSFTFQSSVGGCISFRLDSNGGGVSSGFSGIISCLSPPINDQPCSALTIPVNSSGCAYTLGTTVNSTLSTGMVEPGCGSFSDNDVWYRAVVPSNGTLSVTVVDDNTSITPFAASLALYSGTCSSLSHKGCASSASYSTPSTINYTGTPGETIYIRVWDFADNEGTFNICATTTAGIMGSVITGNSNLTCGATFTDPGGSGNYLTNQYALYTVCPAGSGQFAQVNFSSFNLGSGDFLTVMNGNTSSAPIIGNYSGTANPGIIISSDPSGCLTFAFLSNATGVGSGWNATISCSFSPGNNNTSTFCSTSNCSGGCGQVICGDGNYPTTNNVSSGVQELNATQIGGCWGGTGEISSVWYYFQTQTPGNLEMNLSGPNGQDYDFAIYGPSTNGSLPCPLNSGNSPIRCSYSSVNGNVGLGNGATDFFEGAEGDGWVAPIAMLAGEIYAMVLNISQNGGPQPIVSVDVNGSGSLDCTPTLLPITLFSFDGINEGPFNSITWITNSEINNDYFILERSINGKDWEIIGIVDGAGSTQESHFYSFRDEQPTLPLSYYRLAQTDYDGTKTYSHIIAINANPSNDRITGVFPNPCNETAAFIYNGKSDEVLYLKIINSFGQTVHNLEIKDLKKGQLIDISLENLNTGLFQIIYHQGNWLHSEKLTVIK